MLMGLKIYFGHYFMSIHQQRNVFVHGIDDQIIKYVFASKVTRVVYLNPYHYLNQGMRPI